MLEAPFSGDPTPIPELTPVEVIPYTGQYPDTPEFQTPWEFTQVGQGRGKIDEGQSLISEGYSFCKGTVLWNPRTDRTALFHFEPDPRFMHELEATLAEFSRGGGDIQAIPIKGGVSRDPYYVEELFERFGIRTVGRISVPTTGDVHFGVVWRPGENRIHVRNAKRKELVVFEGFKTRKSS